MTPQELVQKLHGALGSGIKSVILYGSAAAGDHTGKRSDYNILVITEKLGLRELTALSRPSRVWVKSGNHTPLFFTLDTFKRSADVFPIEILDIKESHKILSGDDILSEVEVSRENLRLQLEHELKSKLIQLRERFLMTEGKPKEVVELMIRSLSTFLVLFRAALRLYREEVPSIKIGALKTLARHIQFDTEVFITVGELKEGRKNPKLVDANALFDTYLRTIETVVDAVDEQIQVSS